MGWTVVVRQPAASALAAADAVQHRVWALGGLGAVLFGVLGWWLAGRLTMPLRQLAQQARLQHPAPAGGDEVAQLAGAIGHLLADLRAANETLEARVAKRTAALERANEDLQTFTRSVSHDLRGPLGGIAQLLHQVLDGATVGDARSRRALGLAAAEAERLRRLADELLALAMVEQRALQAQPVDHAALVQAVWQGLLAGPDAPAGAAQPELTLAPLPTLDGDPLLLRQVWTNLLGNALKFSARATPPRIGVSAQDHGGEVEFCVSDNGAGFDPGQADRLFRAFQRLHAASDFPGTGVGLSIVQRAVRRHGGRVRATSTPGQGACFCFTLPRGSAAADAQPAEPAAPANA
jgi:signal transduction histidine kinase